MIAGSCCPPSGRKRERECVCDEAGERKREILYFLKEK